MSETTELTNLIKEEYGKLDCQNTEAISTSMLANSVYDRIDRKKAAPLLVKLAAILELKQLARGICRERQVHEEAKAESGNLFDFQLQPRYPAEREGEDVYVLRDRLTLKERRQNIIRLRREAAAKAAHADALEAETELLLRQGKLTEEEAEAAGRS